MAFEPLVGLAAPVRVDDASFSPDVLVRAGDWRELFALTLSPTDAALLAAARGAGLPVELALTLAVERQLVLEDATACGFGALQTAALLDEAARSSREDAVELGPGQIDARYILALRRAKPLPPRELTPGPVEVLLPCRLHVRAAQARLDEAFLEPAAVEQAREWEIAAASVGMLLGEWAKQQLLLTALSPSR